jgi:hypothetical protein
MAETVQLATLRHALDIAGDVFELSRRIGPGARSLLAMLRGDEEIPMWVFLRMVDYVNEQQELPYRQEHTFDADRHEGTKTSQ